MGLLDVSITLHAHGDAPPDVVWERYADLERWSDWSPQVSSVKCTGTRLKAGLDGTVHALGVTVPFHVTEVGIRSWAWEARPFGLRLLLDHRVLAHGDGAETEIRMKGPAPLLLAYAPFAKLALRKLVTW